MQEKYFKTFVCDQFELEKEIKNWLKENKCKEVDRSAPAILFKDKFIHVAVTVTAEKIS